MIDLLNVHYSTLLQDPSKVIGILMANVLTDILLLGLLLGMNGALETLVSQAHGARSLGLCGAVYKRACAINTALSIPLVCCLFFSRERLRLFG